MEITLSQTKNTMVILHRHHELECPTSGYSRKNANAAEAYRPLNEYFSTLSLAQQDYIFGIYAEAKDIVDAPITYLEIKEKLTDLVTALYEHTDYQRLENWTIEFGRIGYPPDMSDVIPERYNTRINYTKTDYTNLVVLSMFFKMLTPIWGMFSSAPSSLDVGHRDLNSMELLNRCDIWDKPAMVRLLDYCEALTEKHMDELSPTIITKQLGSVEMPMYFLSLAVIRRISIGEIRSIHDTLIKVTSNFLQSTITNLSGGVRDKKDFSSGEEPESVVERHRISQELADYMIVTEEEAIKDIPRAVKVLSPEGDLDLAMQYIHRIESNPLFSIASYHMLLCGLVAHKLFTLRMYLLLNRQCRLYLIAISAAELHRLGYTELAELMVSSFREQTADTMDIYMVTGGNFAPLSKDLRIQLDGIYTYQRLENYTKAKTNPGVSLIESMVTEINQYIWDDNQVWPTQFRDQIAQLLLKRENEL